MKLSRPNCQDVDEILLGAPSSDGELHAGEVREPGQANSEGIPLVGGCEQRVAVLQEAELYAPGGAMERSGIEIADFHRNAGISEFGRQRHGVDGRAREPVEVDRTTVTDLNGQCGSACEVESAIRDVWRELP